ncbi:MAG: BamA/TamA family outer membrane protein [Candidatus Mycalebacterium zealandia]|nr:MAG: BamA/TamA family outer membrane protein [Candidatus Mycalebacterium zealandia]
MRLLAVPLLIAFLLVSFPAQGAAQESQLPEISKVSIRGGGEIDHDEMKSVISEIVPSGTFLRRTYPEFDRFKVERNMEYLRQFLAGNGYYRSLVTWRPVYEKNKRRVAVEINIKLGKHVVVSEVRINVKGSLAPEQVALIREAVYGVPLKEGERFSVQRFKKAKGVVKNTLLEMGYASAVVNSKGEVRRKERRVEVIFSIEPGPPYVFGNIEIRTEDETLRNLVIENLTYRTGEPSSLSKLFESKRRLVALGYFESVSITSEIDARAAVISTVVTPVRRKTMTLQLGIGAGRVDKLRGRVKLINRHFLHLNRTLEISARASFASQGAAVSIQQTGFLGAKSNLSLLFDIRRDDFPSYEADFFIFSPEVRKDFSHGLFSVHFNPAAIRSEIKSQAGDTNLARGLQDIFLVTLMGGIDITATDNPVDPFNGFTMSADIEISPAFLGSDEEYVKTVFEAAGYFNPAGGIVFAKKFQLGFLSPFGQTSRDEVPPFTRLFAGGNKSMRGFPFQELGPLDSRGDPVGGNSLITGAFEVRFPIWRKIGGVAFLDYGNVFPKSFDYPFGDLRYAVGTGLRYKVAGIPIAVDFGYALNHDSRLKRYQFFLDVGHAF